MALVLSHIIAYAVRMFKSDIVLPILNLLVLNSGNYNNISAAAVAFPLQ